MSTLLRHGILESKRPDPPSTFNVSLTVEYIADDPPDEGDGIGGSVFIKNSQGITLFTLDACTITPPLSDEFHFSGIDVPYYVDIALNALKAFQAQKTNRRWRFGTEGSYTAGDRIPLTPPETLAESIIAQIQISPDPFPI